jgi:hypothetical protein
MTMTRHWRWGLLFIALLFAAYAAWHWSDWRARASLAAGYAARTACGCRYIEGRTMASCRQDNRGVEMMWATRLAEDEAERRITATLPLLAAREARYRAGFGCVLVPSPAAR